MLLEERSVGLTYVTVGIIIMLLLMLVPVAFGRNPILPERIVRSEIQVLETSPVPEPVFSDYRGIAIGTTEAELLERIGTEPRFESEDDYVYVFSPTESAQFLLDSERRVKMISITYSGNGSNALTYEDVFGKDVPLEITTDGKVYKLISYHDAGFWIAYYASSGETPLVTITIQKL